MAQNPWTVESIQAFYFLKCPECDFDTKEDSLFENHATENHPLSFALFDKKYLGEDFDTIDIKEEPLSYSDTQISHDDQKSYTHNQFPPLSSVTENNSLLGVPELKKETADELYIDEKQSRNNEIDLNNSEMETYSTDVSIIGDNLPEDPLNSEVHEEKKQYECFICHNSFGQNETLKAHNSSVHGGIKVLFKCKTCDGSFLTVEELKEHCMTSHLDLKCTVCHKIFEKNESLKAHMAIVHERIKVVFKCRICDGTFSTAEELNGHCTTSHNDLKCTICSSIFLKSQTLKSHIFSVHENIKPFKCSVCVSSFSIVQDLNQHMIVHEEKKQFKCRFCRGVIFSQKVDLLEHVKSFHESSRHYRCSICNENFQYKIDVKKHMKLVHDEIFDRIRKKKKHPEKKPKCPHCNIGFSPKFDLGHHIKNCDKGPEKKPLKCPHCKVSFSTKFTKFDLGLHVKNCQKKLKCPHCNIRFSPKFDLEHHVKNCSKVDQELNTGSNVTELDPLTISDHDG